MSIKASEGPESRRLFVDRESLIVEFLCRVHSPARNDVLFLYGEGGIGKSSLLDQLEDRYARRLEIPRGQFLDPWINLSSLSARELVHRFPSLDSQPVACARINFWERALGKDSRDAFFGLQAIRKRLKLPAPLFQSACVLYVHGTEGLTKEWMAELFPGDRADFAVGLVDQPWTSAALATILHLVAVGAAPVAIPAVGVASLARALWGMSATFRGPELAEKAAKRKLGNAIQDLGSYKPDELIEELPRLLAEDINAYLDQGGKGGGVANRVVLLFDAYDRFIGSERNLSPRDVGDRDRWFRRFLKHLRFEQGAVVVVTGQEPPAWDEEIDFDSRALDYLAVPDARLYLNNAAVQPESRQEALIRYASVAPDQVQPLFLALLVDAHRLASERGAPLDPLYLPDHPTVRQQQKTVVDRLLAAADADLRGAITAVAACRSFEWDAFHWLGERLAFANSRSKFDTLTGLSCVRRSGKSEYVMHSLIRRFLGGEKASRPVQEACRDFRSVRNSIADAIYHEYYLNREEATGSWIGAFRAAASRSDHELCAALLAVREELSASFATSYADEVGEYLARLSRYDDAERELSIAYRYWSGRIGDRAQPPVPNLIEALNNKGSALQSWAELRAERSDHAGAEDKYEAALEAYDRALSLAPNDIEILNNKGSALQSWAELRAERSDHAGAEDKYEAAVEAYDRALSLAPNYVGALNNKGNALTNWGALRVQRSDHAGGEDKYDAAVEAYDRALSLAPNLIEALNNKGSALQSWAELRAEHSDHAGGEDKYDAAVEAYDQALSLAPNDIGALNNKGSALQRWAVLRAQRSDHAGGEDKYDAAVEAYDRALSLAPNYIGALNNKGSALQSWADLGVQRSDHAGAEEKYEAAVETYDRALSLAPNDTEVLNNKGNALQNWADLRAQRSDHAGAEDKYEAAVEAYDRALSLAPNYIGALNNKGDGLTSWADLRAQQSDHAGAEGKYDAAVEAYDRALSLAPNLIVALNNKGRALQRWASLKFAVGEPESAEGLLDRSSISCRAVIAISPNPQAYRVLAMNLVRICQITDHQKRYDMLNMAMGICADWEAGFPWDSARIIEIQALIRAERDKPNSQ